MSKSAASVSGKDAKTQDKRISGQSMADKKLRKADGKSSDAKVAASEAKEYTVKVTGGIMRPGSTDNVKVKAKSPDHAINQVKKTHINRHKGDFRVDEDSAADVLKRRYASNHPDDNPQACLLYTSPSPRDATLSRMPSSA